MSIGKNIRALRESRNITQKELADAIGVTDKAVSTWEKDIKTPRMGSIQKIADYFSVKKSDIIEEATNNEPPVPTDSTLKFALFGTDGEITDEMLEDVKRYAQFIKERKKNEST